VSPPVLEPNRCCGSAVADCCTGGCACSELPRGCLCGH
jgi:hypothetical protein